MADGLCGPSNALQSFQKHSNVDRTLQQDRLVNRPGPVQGFRSLGRNAGILDAEYEAFKNGQPAPMFPESHAQSQQLHHSNFAHALPQNMQQAGPANWTEDFQRLSVAGPSSRFQEIPYETQYHQQQNAWNSEFAQLQMQQSSSSAAMQQNYNAPIQRLSALNPMASQYQLMYPASSLPLYNQNENRQIPMQQIGSESFDEEAFARAFDEAAMSGQEDAQVHTHMEQAVEDESPDYLMNAEPQEAEMPRIGSDLIPADLGQHDADAMARTAGDLLTRVQHDKSSKFQNSMFLDLMRQLRDKEVKVAGDKIVDTQTGEAIQPWNDLHPTADRMISSVNHDLGKSMLRESLRGNHERLVNMSSSDTNRLVETGADLADSQGHEEGMQERRDATAKYQRNLADAFSTLPAFPASVSHLSIPEKQARLQAVLHSVTHKTSTAQIATGEDLEMWHSYFAPVVSFTAYHSDLYEMNNGSAPMSYAKTWLPTGVVKKYGEFLQDRDPARRVEHELRDTDNELDTGVLGNRGAVDGSGGIRNNVLEHASLHVQQKTLMEQAGPKVV